MATPKFLDAIFAPFRRERVNPRETKGTGGTAVYGGFIQVNEKSADLQGEQKYVTLSNILANVSIVAAGTRYFLNLVTKAGWKVEPADDSPQAVEIAETVEEMLHDMTTPWHRVVRRAAMFRFWGFSVQEWTAKRRDDGQIGLLDVEPRPQRTIEKWDLDESGTVHGVVQRAPQDSREIYLPRTKLVYMVDDTLNDSPEGMGLFRHLVEPAERLRRYQQLEGFGFETDLRGIPVLRAPFEELNEQVEEGTLTEAQRAALEAPLEDFAENHIKGPKTGLLLDSAVYESQDEAGRPSAIYKWDMALANTDGEGPHADLAVALERITREMARVLGVEVLLLGGDGKGSLALARDKTQQLALLVDATLLELREGLTTDVVKVLGLLNGWPDELLPTLKTESIQFRDVEQVTSALVDMATAGAILAPDDPAIDEIRDLLGLSRQPEIDPALLQAMPGQQPPGQEPEQDDVEEVEEDDGDDA